MEMIILRVHTYDYHMWLHDFIGGYITYDYFILFYMWLYGYKPS